MTTAAISFAIVRFAVWELALFAAAWRLAEWLGWSEAARPAEKWLAVLAIEVTLESSFAALFSFAGLNSAAAYWMVCGACLLSLLGRRKWGFSGLDPLRQVALMAALVAPLIFLSFKPVQEIDSINYLHYLIDWMANRATPYTFATNYVAFWELSFLPVWMVTGVDFFFPLLAMKAVLLLGLAAWLVGRELEVPPTLLLWTVFGSLVMRHYWFEYSGVPTLKNDALHGAGFVLLALVVLRAVKGRPGSGDMTLLALGAAFAAVKYTGIFMAALVVLLLIVLKPSRPAILSRYGLAAAAFFVFTSGHYYLQNLIRYGSPFYPFQINIAFIHLPGTADLSDTSILFSLHDPVLWRAFFAPAAGISPAGFLFPEILAAVLLASLWKSLTAGYAWLRHHTHPDALDWVAFLLLCGWFLYFRSVFSASGYAGDLAFIRNNLNSLRYVDGVLAVSEVFLVALLARVTWLVWPLVGLNAASRLVELYSKIPAGIFPWLWIVAAALLTLAFFLVLGRRALFGAVVCLVAATPALVQRNRLQWTTYWNELKPPLQLIASKDLADLALTDGGYYAGHVVAAGNPVHPEVRALLPEQLDALPPAERPRYLAVLVTSGSAAATDWRARYGARLANWGYAPKAESTYGALLERKF